MKEIKVKLIDKVTLELLEDAKTKDKIKLDNLEDIQLDLTQIEAKLKEGKDKEYQKLLEKELTNIEEQYQLKIKAKETEVISKNEIEISKKDSKIEQLKIELNTSLRA